MLNLPKFAMLTLIACASAEAQVSAMPHSKNSEPSNIQTMVGRQSLDGFNVSSMNADFLKWFEQYSRKRVEQISSEYFNSIGKSPKKIELMSEATYFEKDRSKLAVIRLFNPSMKIYFLMVGGIVGNEFVRVGCFHYSSSKIPMTYGECGKKISEVYSINF